MDVKVRHELHGVTVVPGIMDAMNDVGGSCGKVVAMERTIAPLRLQIVFT
jgi:hypothetical protein